MRKLPLNLLMPIVVAIAVSAAACSKGSTESPLSPSSPAPAAASAPSPAPAPVAGGASISGVVLTGAGRVTVSLNGTANSTMSDDDGNFALQNVPAGAVTLTIAGNGFSAQLAIPTVNANERVRVTVRVNGNSATLDDQQREAADNQVEIEGLVSSITGSTIIVGSQNTAITVPPAAVITRSGAPLTLSALVAGLRVEVYAVRSGATLTATRVNIESSTTGGADDNGGTSGGGNGSDDTPGQGETEFSGVVATRPTGTCPAITLTVGSTKVVTNSSTNFDDVSCAALVAGDTVTVEGAPQTDGSVIAKEIKKAGSQSGSGGGNSGGGSGGSGKDN